MRIRIINYEKGLFNGILSKFAEKMRDELLKRGEKVSIGTDGDKKADICHHINYQSYRHVPDTINTLMVTHITTPEKLENLQEGMKTADWGICMSRDTERYLVYSEGMKNLSTILPAHDIHKKPIVVYIPTNVYPDGCKREWMFTELVKNIDKRHFVFLVMGTGWKPILGPLVQDGLQVQYVDTFDYSVHLKMLQSSQYALYFGEDEGSMGILDASSCGLRTIAPNIGFHQDIGIDYPFSTQEELQKVFDSLTPKVWEWTWSKYVDEHLKLWKTLCGTRENLKRIK